MRAGFGAGSLGSIERSHSRLRRIRPSLIGARAPRVRSEAMINGNGRVFKLAVFAMSITAISAIVYQQPSQRSLNDLPNRLPEAAPYVVAEAQAFPPPYHEHWESEDSPGQCQTCHQKIFDE